jgi:hypothetical protein
MLKYRPHTHVFFAIETTILGDERFRQNLDVERFVRANIRPLGRKLHLDKRQGMREVDALEPY